MVLRQHIVNVVVLLLATRREKVIWKNGKKLAKTTNYKERCRSVGKIDREERGKERERESECVCERERERELQPRGQWCNFNFMLFLRNSIQTESISDVVTIF